MVKAQGMCRSMRRGNATPSCQDTGPASRVAGLQLPCWRGLPSVTPSQWGTV